MNPTTTTNLNTSITPYLMFGGRCEEAIAFYKSALGAEVEMVMLFKDSPEPTQPGMLPPGFENKVMHASFVIRGTRIMASDGCNSKSKFESFSLSLTVGDEAEAERIFASLLDGGEVQMPLGKTFWARRFGILKDRFGLQWMIMVPPEMEK